MRAGKNPIAQWAVRVIKEVERMDQMYIWQMNLQDVPAKRPWCIRRTVFPGSVRGLYNQGPRTLVRFTPALH